MRDTSTARLGLVCPQTTAALSRIVFADESTVCTGAGNALCVVARKSTATATQSDDFSFSHTTPHSAAQPSDFKNCTMCEVDMHMLMRRQGDGFLQEYKQTV